MEIIKNFETILLKNLLNTKAGWMVVENSLFIMSPNVLTDGQSAYR